MKPGAGASDRTRPPQPAAATKPVTVRATDGTRPPQPVAATKPVAVRAEADGARLQAREAQARRATKEAAIREQVKKQMAEEAVSARSRALEEFDANGGSVAERQDEMFGTALAMLIRELPPESRRASRPPSAAGATPVAAANAPAGPAPAEPAQPALSTVEQLSLQLLQESALQNKEMANELAELEKRRSARKLAAQLERDRVASGLTAPLPAAAAAAHASLFSWKPPPMPGRAAAVVDVLEGVEATAAGDSGPS
ncbi:hypothetical protein T492DRAFT_971230 [Pavlovales sp. CCMP2436]|nr:hypothetical protein T492DRAFT_971230 [Pavlovales sp. CCMP2436]